MNNLSSILGGKAHGLTIKEEVNVGSIKDFDKELIEKTVKTSTNVEQKEILGLNIGGNFKDKIYGGKQSFSMLSTNNTFGKEKLNIILGSNKSSNNFNMMLGSNKNSSEKLRTILGTRNTGNKIGMMLGSTNTNKINMMLGNRSFGSLNTSNKLNMYLPKFGRSTLKPGSFKNSIVKIENGAQSKLFKNPETVGWNRVKHQKGLSMFGDFDKDGVKNILDCQPKNRRKQGVIDRVGNWVQGRGWVDDGEVATEAGPLQTFDVESNNDVEGSIPTLDVNSLETYKVPKISTTTTGVEIPLTNDYVASYEEQPEVVVEEVSPQDKIKSFIGGVGSSFNTGVQNFSTNFNKGINEIRAEEKRKQEEEEIQRQNSYKLQEEQSKGRNKTSSMYVPSSSFNRRNDFEQAVSMGLPPSYNSGSRVSELIGMKNYYGTKGLTSLGNKPFALSASESLQTVRKPYVLSVAQSVPFEGKKPFNIAVRESLGLQPVGEWDKEQATAMRMAQIQQIQQGYQPEVQQIDLINYIKSNYKEQPQVQYQPPVASIQPSQQQVQMVEDGKIYSPNSKRPVKYTRGKYRK